MPTDSPETTRQPPLREVSATTVSSGGGGTFFEEHVDAYWLTLLLARSFLPIIKDSLCTQVHLQAERLGWKTDDFLVEGTDGAGRTRRLIGQVKRTFTISAADEECSEAMKDFWADFKKPDWMSADHDRFVLVTLRGSNVLLEGLGALLEQARAARSGEEFEQRLSTRGLVSNTAIRHCEQIRAIIQTVEPDPIARAELWPFLRLLHLLSLDLTTPTAQTEAIAKSLLAYTATSDDPAGAAAASWSALLEVCGGAMQGGHSFRRDDLPAEILARHAPVSGADHRALQALRDHSAVILGGIKATIGGHLHLPRVSIVEEVLNGLVSSQVVLVTGPAGSGKSAVARDAVERLAPDHFMFCFRAEEFATPHLNDSLQRGQLGMNAARLAATLAGQSHKVMLIESAERLLEASTRDAFSDLLTMLRADPTWKLIITCRDYSTDLVRDSLLGGAGVSQRVVALPPLSEDEVAAVVNACPSLGRPLQDVAMRRLLANPYFMDKALLVPWVEHSVLPQDEREFRRLFWRHIVCDEAHRAGGMPARRGQTFVQVALRRARSMTPQVECGDLDAGAVEALRKDSLLTSSEDHDALVAPAHDVLEDWAVLRWLDEQYARLSGDPHDISRVVDAHPAIRRAYRKWVGEAIALDPDRAAHLFKVVSHAGASGVPAHFRDDTLVALLRSAGAPEFLRARMQELSADEKRLLLRVIHLLRVACVCAPPYLDASSELPFSIPEGGAWAGVLSVVAPNLSRFGTGEAPLLLGLVDDWARGVNWQTPYPEGAQDVARVVHWLLPLLSSYRSEKDRKRAMRILLKIPLADPDGLRRLLTETTGERHGDRPGRELTKLLLEGLDGWAVARGLPDLLIEVASQALLASEEDLDDEHGFQHRSLGVDLAFGMREGHWHEAPPASAYRGPFLPLLRFHPRKGMAFVLKVANHSADWYAHPRVYDRLEPAAEVQLLFADGHVQKQWCNGRLWGAYRGVTVAPYVLQSILMAFEQWLLEQAEAFPDRLDAVLIDTLRRSESACLTAVVSSVATAYPKQVPETLLVLLRAKWPVRLDRSRFSAEAVSPPSGIYDCLPTQPEDAFFVAERRESDAKPHRHRDLEYAICNLQLTTSQPRVFALLDELAAEVPAPDMRAEEDRVWRLALHRMDLRAYRVAEPQPAPSEGRVLEPGQVVLHLEDPEPDVKAMSDESASQAQRVNRLLGILNFGYGAFRRESGKGWRAEEWRHHLSDARSLTSEAGEAWGADLWRGGPGFVAAVCVRDHWAELAPDEQSWCLEWVCAEIRRSGDLWNHHERIQIGTMAPDRACAYVVAALLGKNLAQAQRRQVRDALVVAVTHPVHEVRKYAAQGVGAYLWTIDQGLALRCVNLMAAEATRQQAIADRRYRRSVFVPRGDEEGTVRKAVDRLRQRFDSDREVPADAHLTLDINRGFGEDALSRMLTVFAHAPERRESVAAFQRLAHALVSWWDTDEDRRGRGKGRSRHYQSEFQLRNQLEHFVLRTRLSAALQLVEPLVEASERHPKEVGNFVEGLTYAEDVAGTGEQFWGIWRKFAERVRRVDWWSTVDSEYGFGRELVSAVFLNIHWKEGVRHWRRLEGYQGEVPGLFNLLPASERVTHAFVSFLYHVGEGTLPAAFGQVATKLRVGDPSVLLSNSDTMFMLEVLLRRFVYGRPAELKRQRTLREDVLFLLDLLVERGSSAAFRLRDDFVTPVLDAR